MATYQILSWKNIPTGVKAKDENGTARASLHLRFQSAVDSVATKLGQVNSTDYMAGFEWSEPVEREGSAKEVADAVAAELEAEFPAKRLLEVRRELEAEAG